MTDAQSTIISALLAAVAGLIAAVVSYIAADRKNRNAINSLKIELRASYRSELAKRQIEACEKFWELFGPTSTTEGNSRIISKFKTTPTLDIAETDAFIANFQSVFSSKAGLYLSKQTRDELHEFRDFLIEMRNSSPQSSNQIRLSRVQADRFKLLRGIARLAIRREIGSTDLKVAPEGLRDHND